MSTKILCLSDTHGFFDERFSKFAETCDEIWHAGDIGSLDVAHELSRMKPLKAVHGNIDGWELRREFPLHQRFHIEGIDVWITHIGGYPGRYDPSIKSDLLASPPDLFICGHSHILKIMNDEKAGLLHINPGAAGRFGIHKVQTAVRFTIDIKQISNLEIIEFERKP
jgi:uncharacterized protein